MPVTEEQVKEVLKTVLDPEIQVSVLDLGLIYGIEIEPFAKDTVKVKVRMTLTTPACPYGPAILGQVYGEVSKIPGVEKAEVEIAWDPPYDPRKMASPEAKMQMGFVDELEENVNEIGN